jgi:beta-lactamase regulating signal transducer with metallopeptidase domain
MPAVLARSVAPVVNRAVPVARRASIFAVRPSVLETMALAWFAVAATLLGWLAIGAIQVRRLVATATELTTPDWAMPLCEVADRLDLEQPPRLVMSDRIEMAFACRAFAPTIVVPATAEEWNDDRRRAVLFHELAHVKRHDLLGHTLGRLACALYWFHPLVWTAAKRLRAESEMACDDLVLSCGARPSEYAQHLLDMVTSVRNHGAPVMALPMARKKEFEGRMLAILDPAVRRASPGRLQAAAVVATIGALSLTVAAVAPASARQTPDSAMASVRPKLAMNGDTARKLIRRTESTESQTQTLTDTQVQTQTRTQSAMSFGVSPRDVNQISKEAEKFGAGVAAQVLHGLGLSLQGATRTQGPDTARVALLIKVLATDTDADVRRAAAWGLSEVPSANARGALIRALQNDTDNQVREMAAWALAEVESDAAGSALANALVHDKSVQVRRTAAWALGNQDGHANADVLISAISDSDPEVRQTAIWALGQLGVRTAPTVLLNALTDNSPPVRETAAWSVGQTSDSAAVRAIVRAFETETDTKVKRAQLWALAQIGTAPTSVIESAMKSSDPELRRHAVALLAGGGDAWPWPWPWPQPRPTP